MFQRCVETTLDHSLPRLQYMPLSTQSLLHWDFSTCIFVGGGAQDQWLFLVPIKGGRDYITPQKAIYKWYISGIYCQLGDYMPPTTF